MDWQYSAVEWSPKVQVFLSNSGSQKVFKEQIIDIVVEGSGLATQNFDSF